MIAMAEEFLTIEEVAQKLRVSDSTIKRMLKAKSIAGYKINGAWRITREDLENYLKKQKNIQ